ncbi:MAG: hypothetical protein IH831_02045 [Planctomycetes bacterium]|nr:hypothetical protein [Planctomycetota bacterium]
MSAGSQLASPRLQQKTSLQQKPRLQQDDFVHQDPWHQSSRTATVVTVLSLVALLNAIGLLVVVRRLVGALGGDLPRDAMLLTAVVITATVACARIAWRRAFPLRKSGLLQRSWGDQFVGWGSSVGLALVAVGCCYPAYHTSDWLIWLPMLVADQFWRQSFFDAGDPLLRLAEEPGKVLDPSSTVKFPSPAKPAKSAQQWQEEIIQRLYRVRNEDGSELIYGTLRADFQTGQRTAVLHVGFCPPLPYLPEIEAEALPGSEARLKIVQALAHGARLNVRLPSTPTEDCHVWIDMAATPVTAS